MKIHIKKTKNLLLTLVLHYHLVIILMFFTVRIISGIIHHRTPTKSTLYHAQPTGWSTMKIVILADFVLTIKSSFREALWKSSMNREPITLVIFIRMIIYYFLCLLFVCHLVRMELCQSKSIILKHVNAPLKATPPLLTVSIPASAISMPAEFRPENASFAKGVKLWLMVSVKIAQWILLMQNEVIYIVQPLHFTNL